MVSRRTRKSSRGSGRVMRLSSYFEKDASAMQGAIRKGPLTLLLVFSTSCPHCHTYMPIWKKLCQTKGRKANMISMEASTYQQTPLSEQKPVSGVPSVLYIDKNGKIAEIDEPRDTTTMTSVVQNKAPSFTQPMPAPLPKPSAAQPPIMTPAPLQVQPNSIQVQQKVIKNNGSIIPGTRITNSELKPLPARGGHRGGHRGGDWSSALMAAAPAAVLLGAYAAFPMQRSSGLGPARTTRKKKSRHA